jgi:hypothetical protein
MSRPRLSVGSFFPPIPCLVSTCESPSCLFVHVLVTPYAYCLVISYKPFLLPSHNLSVYDKDCICIQYTAAIFNSTMVMVATMSRTNHIYA